MTTSPTAHTSQAADPPRTPVTPGTDAVAAGTHDKPAAARNETSNACGGGEFRERPILFSGEMVKALLDGRKTQTRRIVKPQPWSITAHWPDDSSHVLWQDVLKNQHYYTECGYCPYGRPSDRLWVRETWQDCRGCGRVSYRADKHDAGCICYEPLGRWRPSIFMRRDDSRITLEIVSVRVERVQEITSQDCVAEGLELVRPEFAGNLPFAFAELWDSINAKKHPWDANPWVWRIDFRRIKP
jgi:hypothetical protein